MTAFIRNQNVSEYSKSQKNELQAFAAIIFVAGMFVGMLTLSALRFIENKAIDANLSTPIAHSILNNP